MSTRYSDTSPEMLRIDPDDDPRSLGPGAAGVRLWAALAVAAIAVAGFGGVVAYGYLAYADRGASAPAPLIKADDKPFKIRPDNPGGMEVQHKEKEIFDLGGRDPSTAKRGNAEILLPLPETPLPKPVPQPVIQPVAISPASSPTASDAAAVRPAASAEPEPLISTGPPPFPAPRPPPAAPPARLASLQSHVMSAPQSITPAAGVPSQASTPAVAPIIRTAATPAAVVGGRYRIQVGAMRSEAEARDAWEKVRRKHPDVVGALSANYTRVELPAAANSTASMSARCRMPARRATPARSSRRAERGALLSHRRDGEHPRAVILGCAGPTLSGAEASLFAEGNPLGFILFARNVVDPTQVETLCAALRASIGRPDAPILVDQEGGRVQRLRPPHWRAAPPASRFGALHEATPLAACEAARLNARLLAWDCLCVGMNVICAPCADLPAPGAHDVIGDRAYGRDVATVIALARATAEGIADLGAIPVLKHLPGHGRAGADSHHELPTVTATRAELSGADAAVFRALRDLPWAMSAHVLYTALDAQRPGTISPDVIRFIREEIGFDGVLVSDDLAMNALGGTPEERALAALAAGCDVALYCAGTAEINAALLKVVPRLTDRAVGRIAAAQSLCRPRVPPEPQRWLGRVDALLGGLCA